MHLPPRYIITLRCVKLREPVEASEDYYDANHVKEQDQDALRAPYVLVHQVVEGREAEKVALSVQHEGGPQRSRVSIDQARVYPEYLRVRNAEQADHDGLLVADILRIHRCVYFVFRLLFCCLVLSTLLVEYVVQVGYGKEEWEQDHTYANSESPTLDKHVDHANAVNYFFE